MTTRSLQEIDSEIAATKGEIGRRPSRDPSRRIAWTEDQLHQARDRSLRHRERAAWHRAKHHRWRRWAPGVAERHRDAWQAHQALREAEDARAERHEGSLVELRAKAERYSEWDEQAKPLRARLEALRVERTARLTQIHSQALGELQDAGLSGSEIRDRIGDHARRLARMESRHGHLVDDPEARIEAERLEAERRARWRPWERDADVHM